MRREHDTIGNPQDGVGGGAGRPSVLSTEEQRDTTRETVLVELGRRLGPDSTLAAVDDAELEQRVRVGAAELAAATCRWLELLAEFVVRGVWADQGCTTPSQWLSWAIGLAPSTAREHVRVALRLRECPLVRDRFAAGTLSYSKVRAITRIADPATEALLVTWADAAPAAVLERIVADTRRLRRTTTAPDERDDLGCTTRWRDDGTFELRLRVDAATGLAVEQQLDRLVELADHDADGAGDGDDRGDAVTRPSLHRRRGDALVAALDTAVAAGPTDASGLDRHAVVVHADATALLARQLDRDPAAGTGPGTTAAASAGAAPDDPAVLLRDGRGRTRALSGRQLRRLACTATVGLTVTEPDGAPVGLGRTRRAPDTRLRRLLAARDRSCRFPGCGATRHLHAHHVVWWSHGGATDLENLVLLCAHHHRVVHDHGWTLRPDGPGRWTFHPPAGRPGTTAARPWAQPLPGTTERALRTALAAHAHDTDLRDTGRLGSALQPAQHDGSRYDHDLAVGILHDRIEHGPPDLGPAVDPSASAGASDGVPGG